MKRRNRARTEIIVPPPVSPDASSSETDDSEDESDGPIAKKGKIEHHGGATIKADADSANVWVNQLYSHAADVYDRKARSVEYLPHKGHTLLIRQEVVNSITKGKCNMPMSMFMLPTADGKVHVMGYPLDPPPKAQISAAYGCMNQLHAFYTGVEVDDAATVTQASSDDSDAEEEEQVYVSIPPA